MLASQQQRLRKSRRPESLQDGGLLLLPLCQPPFLLCLSIKPEGGGCADRSYIFIILWYAENKFSIMNLIFLVAL